MLELLQHTPDPVREFNKVHPLASFVKYRNDAGEVVEAQVRFPAETTEGHIDVVWLTGNYNAVPLERIIR